MPSTKEIFQKYPNPIFIETGSQYGDGIQMALDAGFKTIYSIELGVDLYSHCIERFKGVSNVHLYKGDSSLVLPELLKDIKELATFWLDSHYCGIGTAIGNFNSPIMEELEAIKNHPIKNHIIMIDDLRGWYKDTYGFDTLDLMKKIKEINPNYTFILEDGYDYNLEIVYSNDILVAKC